MGQRAQAVVAGVWPGRQDLAMTAERSKPATAPAASVLADLAAYDDRSLVRAFLDGRREAFDVIVERYRRQVYQLCYRFTGNHEDAADLAQDVFIRAFRGLRAFKGDAALGTWLYRIGVNASLNRAAARRPAAEPIDEKEYRDLSATDPLQEIVRGERGAVVRAAIRKLPKKQRATLILRVYHELSHDEIARVLGGTVGAAKANFFHAIGNLKRLMQ
jgi:RNA polymerase sigma-70 factor (ECF subfamily)